MSVHLTSVDQPRAGLYRWLGAISFEDRCTGSLTALETIPRRLVRIHALKYPTVALPEREDLRKREKHLQRISAISLRITGKPLDKPPTVHAYRPSGILAELRRLARIAMQEGGGIIVDTTCLTKCHTVALASWLTTAPEASNIPITLAYTRPLEYAGTSTNPIKLGNWADIFFAPCGLDLEPYRRDVWGIVLLGHEGSRIKASLRQIWPRMALVILSQENQLDPMMLASRTSNAEILVALEQEEHDDWEFITAHPCATEEVYKRIAALASKAEQEQHRILLYPYGPKPLILTAALAAQSFARGKAWYSYAVPKSYDIEYTKGVGQTWWFNVNETDPVQMSLFLGTKRK